MASFYLRRKFSYRREGTDLQYSLAPIHELDPHGHVLFRHLFFLFLCARHTDGKLRVFRGDFVNQGNSNALFSFPRRICLSLCVPNVRTIYVLFPGFRLQQACSARISRRVSFFLLHVLHVFMHAVLVCCGQEASFLLFVGPFFGLRLRLRLRLRLKFT
jgi:hypothetical protein